MKNLLIFAGLFAALSVSASAQAANGGTYKLDQAVIAGGGGTSTDSSGNIYSITGAIGQAVAGSNTSNPPYALQSGFYTAAPLAPTAAPATIGGRILTSDGRGIRSVVITLTDSKGVRRTATSSAFGHFRFADVTAGEVYVLSAKAKQFQFEQNSLVVSVTENLLELNFIALPK